MLIDSIIAFRDVRNWAQYHTPKNLAISIAIEAAELMELFQWSEDYRDIEDVGNEIADIYIYLITLAHDLGIDIEKVVENKLHVNAINYPVSECYGKYGRNK